MMASFNAIDSYHFDPVIGAQNLTEFTSNESLGRFYLIKYQQLNIGYIALTFGFSFEYKGRDAFIDELYIKKEYRKHGIGKLAMDFIAIEAKKLNVNAIHLEVESHNENAYILYTKKGYQSNNRKLMTKKIKLLVFSLFFLINVVLGQDCDEANYTFTTQEAIDQFGINYPDCKDITGSLTIDGTDIVNLNGLNQIKTIGTNLQIQNCSLTDLTGLDSLEYISKHLKISGNNELMNLLGIDRLQFVGERISIHENNSLTSLEGLQNVDMTYTSSQIIITDCPELAYCQIENLCEYLAHYSNYYISNNSDGCQNRDVIVSTCLLPIDTIPGMEFVYDGFEEWNPEGIPLNWEGSIYEHEGVPNIEMTTSLTEGNYSLLLRSNIPFFEGNLDTDINNTFEETVEVIDISFTYRCTGEGRCKVNVGQGIHGSPGANYRNIWNAVAGDTTQYKAIIQNIKVNSPFDHFKLVELIASPVWTALGSYGTSEFTIDDFLITQKSVNVSTASVEHTNKVEIYPNPVFSDLYINSSKSYDRIVIFNHLGQKIKTYSFEGSINISHLSPGVYYLIIEGVDNHVIRKIIKM